MRREQTRRKFLNQYQPLFCVRQPVEIVNLYGDVVGRGTIKKLGKSRIYVTRDMELTPGNVGPKTYALKPRYIRGYMPSARPVASESKPTKDSGKTIRKTKGEGGTKQVKEASTTSGKNRTQKQSAKPAPKTRKKV